MGIIDYDSDCWFIDWLVDWLVDGVLCVYGR